MPTPPRGKSKSRNKKLYLLALAGGISLLPLSKPAEAGLVNAGGTAHASGTTEAARPDLSGAVVRDELIPFTVTSGGGSTIFTGTLQDRVIRAVDGTLSFVQFVHADSSLARRALLDYIRRDDFSGFATDVDYRTDGAGDAGLHPEKVRRTADGASVQLGFHDRLSAGDETLAYFVKTDAKAFDVTGGTTLGFIGRNSIEGSTLLATAHPTEGDGTNITDGTDGNGTDNGNGGGAIDPGPHNPPAAVPLPVAVAAFPIGAVVAGIALRRMRKSGR